MTDQMPYPQPKHSDAGLEPAQPVDLTENEPEPLQPPADAGRFLTPTGDEAAPSEPSGSAPAAGQPVDAQPTGETPSVPAPADKDLPAQDSAPGQAPADAAAEIDAAEVDRAFPEGTVDLTSETPIVATPPVPPAPAFAPGFQYGSTPAAEPVPGTVEVEHTALMPNPNETVVMPGDATLDDHRAARARALGEVDPGADVVAVPAQYTPPSVYRGWPSFTLFVFRIVVATILSIRATQELLNFTQTKLLWDGSILPNPSMLATAQIVVEYLIALMLVLGLASRVAGVLMMLLYIGVLSFVVWGASNPFQAGVVGFKGEYEVIMVAIGLVFAGIGGGRAAVDGSVHRARLEKKNAKLS